MSPRHKSGRLCSGLVAFLLCQTFWVLGAPREQSVSTSRQFVVYGPDVRVRGAICELAEGAKRGLLALLAQRDSWVTPILINAHYPQANLPEAPRTALTLGQTGFGLKLQLDLTIDPIVGRPEVRRELLRALLVEMMYRESTGIAAGTACSSPPDWLTEGVLAKAMNLDAGLSQILSLPVDGRTLVPLEKFLRQKPELLDAPGLSLYRAYSCALVELLARPPDGPGHLARFILDLATASNNPMAGLRRHFPGLFESDAMAEKTWENQVARFSKQQPYQLLGSAATERILDEHLRLKISTGPSGKTFELAEFPTFLKEPSARRVLAELSRDFSALALRANPVYQPLILEYGKIAAALSRGKTKGIARRLDQLTASRKAIAAQVRGIDDYLNWFEATGLRDQSGVFTEYLKTAESAGNPPPMRRDRISVYLNALETQLQE